MRGKRVNIVKDLQRRLRYMLCRPWNPSFHETDTSNAENVKRVFSTFAQKVGCAEGEAGDIECVSCTRHGNAECNLTSGSKYWKNATNTSNSTSVIESPRTVASRRNNPWIHVSTIMRRFEEHANQWA